MTRLEAGGVNEHELRLGPGENAPYRVARRLRPPGGDAHLRAHQPVQQRGLADVGPANDRDCTATKRQGPTPPVMGPSTPVPGAPPPVRPCGGSALSRSSAAPSLPPCIALRTP